MAINLINRKGKKKNVEQDYNIANLSWYDPDRVTNEVLFNETAKAASLHGWLALLGRIFEKNIRDSLPKYERLRKQKGPCIRR